MRALLLLALCAGCSAHRVDTIDVSLPDGPAARAPLDPWEVLTGATSNLDPTPRARALGILVRSSAEPAGGEWGPRALYDPDPWVQRAGVLALASRIGEPEAVALLESYVRRDGVDPYVRGAAAIRLAGAGHLGTLDTLSAAWRAERLPWNRAPLALAAAVMGDTEAVEPLADTIRGGDLPLEVGFVLDLGRSGLTALVPALRDGVERIEPELALPYAAARLALGDPAGEAPLRRALAAPEVEQRLEALDYLSRLDSPGSDALLKRARAMGPDLVRWYAVLALAARGEMDPERLERAVLHSDREVRELAVRFAAQAASTSDGRRLRAARRVLDLGLRDEDPVVRLEALRSMTDLGLRAPREIVSANLADEYLAIRLEAAGAALLLPEG